MSPFIIPVVMFLSAAAVFIVWITTRYRERIAMVEKGLSSEDIKAIYAREARRDPVRSLKWGILFVFAGVGVILGNVLYSAFHFEEGGVIAGTIAVFVGAGLLLFYTIASKKLKE